MSAARRRYLPRVGGGLTVIALAGLWVACSPALNWREARVEGSGLIALFPCRPLSQARKLSLAGRPVTLTMQACEVDGATYAVSAADVVDPAGVGAAMRALRESTEANLHASAQAASAALAVQGVTPNAEGGRWAVAGHRPDGQAVQAELAVIAHGTWVLQATVIGQDLPALAVTPFFEGLRFAP
jgi:hypothetical protein